MGFISTAATSGLNGVVDRPWKEEDQSMPLLANPAEEEEEGAFPEKGSGMLPMPGGGA